MKIPIFIFWAMILIIIPFALRFALLIFLHFTNLLDEGGHPLWVWFAFLAMNLLFYAFVWLAWLGNGWSRWVILVWIMFDILTTISMYSDSHSIYSPVEFWLESISTLLQTIGCLLLFLPPSSKWFFLKKSDQ
ncbi:MAG TPA: hypothetical protein VIC08_13090 [Cellvibrionaceae bacterium]